MKRQLMGQAELFSARYEAAPTPFQLYEGEKGADKLAEQRRLTAQSRKAEQLAHRVRKARLGRR
jgi:hypothetical protein